MEGYMIMGDEVQKQLLSRNSCSITHVFLQAGVGGFAAAIALSLRKFLSNDSKIIIVEPAQAKTLFISLQNEKPMPQKDMYLLWGA